MAKGNRGRDGRKERKRKSAARKAGEWAGLRVPVDQQASAHFLVWLEAKSGLVVSCRLDEAGGPTLGDVLENALEGPNTGLVRVPQRLRVANDTDVAAVQAILPAAEVVVGGLPSIAALTSGMARVLGEARARNGRRVLRARTLDGGTPGLAFRLHDVSAMFLLMAPWTRLSGIDHLRFDVPALGVRQACAVVMGGAGEEFGILLFPSLDAYHDYAAAMEPSANAPWDASHRNMTLLALTFEHESELGRDLARELGQYGFPRAGLDGWPMVMRRSSTNTIDAVTTADLELMIACVEGIATFLYEREEHGDGLVPFTTEQGMEGTVQGPFDSDGNLRPFAHDDLGDTITVPSVQCDCDAGPEDAAFDARSIQHVRLNVLDGELAEYADRALGEEWHDEYLRSDGPLPECVLEAQSLKTALHLYELPDAKDAIAGHFIEVREPLPPALAPALRAQREASTDVWVVEPGATDTQVHLRRLRTGEVVRVHDCALARTGDAGDSVVARLVSIDGERVLRGLLPFVLPEPVAEKCYEAALESLSLPHETAVPPASRALFTIALLVHWQVAVGTIALGNGPSIVNMDGDQLEFIEDVFAVRDEAALRSALDSIDCTRRVGEAGDMPEWIIFDAPTAPGATLDTVATSRVGLGDGQLVVASNSPARADAASARLGMGLGSLLGAPQRRAGSPDLPLIDASAAEADSPAVRDALRRFKARHSAT